MEVLVVESNMAGNGARALSLLKEWGLTAHFVTASPSDYDRTRRNPAWEADIVSVLDGRDVGQLIDLADRRLAGALVTFDDFHTIPVCAAAAGLGFRPPQDVLGFVNARYKDRMRNVANNCSARIGFAVIEASEPLEKCPIAMPCIVKPVDESGSTGVQYVRNDVQFRAAATNIRHHAAQSMEPLRGSVLCEEWVEGKEYSAELVSGSENEMWRLIGFTEKFIESADTFIEVGHAFPYSFGGTTDHKIKAQITAVLDKMGLHGTVVHVEFKMKDGAPFIVEINARPAGGMIADLIRLTTGEDLIALHLDAVLGQKRSHCAPAVAKYAAVWHVVNSRSGTIVLAKEGDRGGCTGVVETFLKPVGSLIVRKGNADDRLGYAIAVGDTKIEAIVRAQECVKQFSFRLVQ